MGRAVLSRSRIQRAPQQVFLRGLFLALMVLPSWDDDRPACPSLLQRGCAVVGLPELFCLCSDPGVGARVLQGAMPLSLKMSYLAGFVLF